MESGDYEELEPKIREITPSSLSKEQREVIKSLSREEVEILLELNSKLKGRLKEAGGEGFRLDGDDDQEFVCCIC